MYANKTILIVGHASSTFAFRSVAEGADMKRSLEIRAQGYMDNAQVLDVPFTKLPHNDSYTLDYHRPYIDKIQLVDTDGTQMVRVPDVFDCWFESGAMPYAQQHYLGEAVDGFDPQTGKGFPAQFIAEGLDQTRGWFYSLIVLGVALFGKSPYENVIVNGLVLAEDGKKMSKKLQNYPDPVDLANKVGVDAIRFYLLSSSLMRAEDLNFSEKGVLELQRKNIGRLHNVLAMYEMFADGTKASGGSQNILDRWIVARLNQLIGETTAGFKSYELDKATRPITDFIDDVSVWYLRRSRDRFKSDDAVDKKYAVATLRFVLRNLALVMAPSMPFYSEYLWGRIKEEEDAESVHLSQWPEAGEVDVALIEEMIVTRSVVTLGLEARTKANIKVRQPLRSLQISSELSDEMQDLVKDEVNVKEVNAIQKGLTHHINVSDEIRVSGAVELDTTITPELKAEGDVREFIRQIQDLRKQSGLEAKDRIVLTVQASDGGEALVTAFMSEIKKVVGADEVSFGNAQGAEVQAGEHSLTVQLEKK
jgi:isoleucyl-tRNA synthetase